MLSLKKDIIKVLKDVVNIELIMNTKMSINIKIENSTVNLGIYILKFRIGPPAKV